MMKYEIHTRKALIVFNIVFCNTCLCIEVPLMSAVLSLPAALCVSRSCIQCHCKTM